MNAFTLVQKLPAERHQQRIYAILSDKKTGLRRFFCRPALTGEGYAQATAAILTPASAASACALSIASQVNSGSSRPKWP